MSKISTNCKSIKLTDNVKKICRVFEQNLQEIGVFSKYFEEIIKFGKVNA